MNQGRILIVMVDDDPAILQIGKNVLSEKYSVATFSSAEKLFAFLEKSTPALILLDIMMPETGGGEAIKALKSKEQTRNIPVIFLTGHSGFSGEFAGLRLGADDYIVKPFAPELLLKRIEARLAALPSALPLEA
jgi:putative two-component system response regulator